MSQAAASTRNSILALAFIGLAAVVPACSEGYTRPAGGADLRAFGLEPPAAAFDDADAPLRAHPQPQADFPATIAVVRLQNADYHWHGSSKAAGAYTIVTTRDVETDEKFKDFASHPMIRSIVPMNHLVLPSRISHASDLCEAARRIGADMVLVFTLDSDDDIVHHVPELSVATLGLLPEGEAVARCTASAIVLDARSGFVYAVSEGSDEQKRLASAWGGSSARDKARRKAEQKAFHNLLSDLERRWLEVVREYAKPM